MKLFTTRKQIKEKAAFLIRTRCTIEYLYFGEGAFAYNSGIYGWNCDYYAISDNIVICEGYRPQGCLYEQIELITSKFIQLVKPIYNDCNIGYVDKLDKIAKIREEWKRKVVEYLFSKNKTV